MILVVLGTHNQPFARAVRLADQLRLPGEKLLVQHGHTPPVPEITARWSQWYSHEELNAHIREARVVVVHGGSGCIFGAQRQGVRPLVIARLARYGEHVDDHQLELSKRLEASDQVVVWHENEPREKVVRRLMRPADATPVSGPALRPAVWAAARALAL